MGSILSLNANASIIASGDFNEYSQTSAVFDSLRTHLTEIDEVAGIPPVERYTYVYDMNTQQLDHAFISPKLQPGAETQHLHVNNWLQYSARTSDHDPSVSRVKLCTPQTTPPPPPPSTCSTRQVGGWCAKTLPAFTSFTSCACVHSLADQDI